MKPLSIKRTAELVRRASQSKILVIGDVMLDQFIWGRVGRISPEAPVPVVEFERESSMPGGAANVARNLTGLNIATELFGIVGRDEAARNLKRLLEQDNVGCEGVIAVTDRPTSIKTRIIAHQQQVVRVDRENTSDMDRDAMQRLLERLESELRGASAVILGDYGKGVVTQELLDHIKRRCRSRGLWLSVDPKPIHHLSLTDLSLITPNRKEAFELAGIPDTQRKPNPLADPALLRVVETLLENLKPALLLITLGDQGMLLCRQRQQPVHIPTAAQEVFDVSGAGDTVIASFTAAIVAGASPLEAAIFSNHAAGVVVGKFGTATVTPDELLASFKRHP